MAAINRTDVDVSSTQTITGKTLTSPTINSPTITSATLTSSTLTSPLINQINDTNGGAALVVSPTASAVNHAQITNAAAGGNVVVSAVGADTNVSLVLRPKGDTGKVILHAGNTNNLAVFSGPNVAGVVATHLVFNSTLTGVTPSVAVSSTDANVSINLVPKGTGTVQADGNTVETTNNRGQANGYASLDSGGKVPIGQLPNSIMEYQGTWNASTNTPTLANGTGSPGDVYRVSVAGTALGLTFDVGDYAIYNGSTWEKSDTTDAVASVAGRTGTVTLTSSDVGLGNVDNTSNATERAATAALTNKDLTSGTNTFPTFNQNTTGSAATLTTSRNLQTNLASTSSAGFNGSADSSPGVTGTLPVGNGGTGATTLTGLVKGTGTTAMVAATAGTDYITPTGAEAISGKTSITSTGAVTGSTLVSTVATGTAPMTVASATRVENLNATYVTGYGISTSATAVFTLPVRDGNANVTARSFVPGFTTQATAAATTTLTITSSQVQQFTGTQTQTVVLPTTSVAAGASYTIINSSSGDVTVQSSALATIGAALTTGTSAQFIALVATPTTAANWHRR